MGLEDHELLGRVCLYSHGVNDISIVLGISERGLKIVYYNPVMNRLQSEEEVEENHLIPIDMSTKIAREYAEPLLQRMYSAFLTEENVEEDLPF